MPCYVALMLFIFIPSMVHTWESIGQVVIVPNLVNLSFDPSGNLALVAANGVFLLNNQIKSSNNSGVSFDSSCIINSMFFLLIFYF